MTLLAVVSTRRSAAQTPVDPPPRDAPSMAPSVAPPAATAPAMAPPPSAGALTFALGSEPCALDRAIGRCTHGVVAQLGYERRLGRAGSPFSVRVTGDYWRTGGYAFTPFAGVVPNPVTYTRRSRFYGGSVLGVYRLPFALGPVRPYALGGVGVYQYVATTEARVPGGGTVVWRGEGLLSHQTSIAYTVGLGGRVQLGHVEVFGEARLMDMDGPRRSTSNTVGGRLPITVGVRIPF